MNCSTLIYLSLLLFSLVTRAADLPPIQTRALEIFRELINTDTTASSGDTSPVAQNLAKRLAKAGFKSEEMALLGPTAKNRNLLLRYRGLSQEKPVLFIGHLDVVEAKREDWSLDPFKFIERDDFYYGRGTTDMKQGAAQLIAAMIELKKSGFVPKRDFVLALTSGEEGPDSDNGLSWLVAHKPEWLRAAFCVNFDGGGPMRREGRLRSYSVGAAEKAYVTATVETRDRGGHSSRPAAENAIYRLSEALVRISKFRFPVHLNPITRSYFDSLAGLETGQTGEDMKAILQDPPDGEAIHRLSQLPNFNAILRTTAVATMITGGHAENALPQMARATINCRVLPGEKTTEVLAKLREVIADDMVTLRITEDGLATEASPLLPEFMSALQKTVESTWPGLGIVPVMSTGTTDSRFLRNIGIPSFQAGGTAGDVEDNRAHGRDERVGVSDFQKGVDFTLSLLKNLGRGQ